MINRRQFMLVPAVIVTSTATAKTGKIEILTDTALGEITRDIRNERIADFVRQLMGLHVGAMSKNTPEAREYLEQVLDSFLTTLMTNKTIYDFFVMVNEANNSPTVLNRNGMQADVAWKLDNTKTDRFMHLTLEALLKQG